MACLFCEIASKTQPAEIIFEDDQAVAFKDIAPKAPVHLLIIPRRHFTSVNDIRKEDEQLLGHLILIAKELALKSSIHDSGYRLVFNSRKHAGQVVEHLHLHLLGGQPLGPMA